MRTGAVTGPTRLLLALTVVLVACGGDDAASEASAPTETSAPPVCDPPAGSAEAGWRALAASPLSPRAGAVAAWTGCELLVFRGSGNFSDGCDTVDGASLCGEPPRNDGAAYDPATDTWRPLPAAPLVDDRSTYDIGQPRPHGAWTGNELLVVGGEGWGAAAYSPATDAWRSLPGPPVAPRTAFSLTVVGRHAVLFGGTTFRSDREEQTYEADGAAFDLDAATRRSLPAPPGGGRAFHDAFALDGEVVVVGGSSGPGTARRDIEAYDVAADSWRRLPSLPVDLRGGAVAVGGDLVQVGAGEERDRTFVLAEGSDAWVELGRSSFDTFAQPALVAAAGGVVAVGGSGFGDRVDGMEAATLDLETGEWRELPDPPLGIGDRGSVSLVWTGAEVLAWGGEVSTGLTSKTANDGARLPLAP